MEPAVIVSTSIAAVAVIVWLVRLEGRVNGHDESLEGLRDDVKYIRERIDRVLIK